MTGLEPSEIYLLHVICEGSLYRRRVFEDHICMSTLPCHNFASNNGCPSRLFAVRLDCNRSEADGLDLSKPAKQHVRGISEVQAQLHRQTAPEVSYIWYLENVFFSRLRCMSGTKFPTNKVLSKRSGSSRRSALLTDSACGRTGRMEWLIIPEAALQASCGPARAQADTLTCGLKIDLADFCCAS